MASFFTPQVITWLTSSGAAGLVIFVVLIFLREIRAMNTNHQTAIAVVTKSHADARKEDRQVFTETLGGFKVEIATSRTDFALALDKARDSFSTQLQDLHSNMHEKHQNTQDQIINLVKENNKVNTATSLAITELRDELRTMKSSKG